MIETTGRQVSQIALVSAIATELERQGFKSINTRQLNAVIRAADDIVVAVESPHMPAATGMGMDAWMRSDETGESSVALARVLNGKNWPYLEPEGDAMVAHPHDPADFKRCVGLLEAVPALRERLPLAAALSPVWARLIAHWPELEALYREESPTGKAPRLYERMRALIQGERP